MNKTSQFSARLKPVSLGLLAATTIGILAGCHKDHHDNNNNNTDQRVIQQVNVVANKSSYNAKVTDTLVQNPWGLAWSPTGIAWVNDEVTGVSELFSSEGVSQRAPVTIPAPPGAPLGSQPMGIVFNSVKGFTLSNGQAAAFIFGTGSGTISAWNAAAGNSALLIINNSSTSAYTGLTLAASGGANYLYAADARGGKIAVWDTAFKAVPMPFTDPALPAGFVPFGIQLVGNYLYVTYGQPGPDGRIIDSVGSGIVDVFNPDGSYVKRFASGGLLSAPWAVVQVPASFLGPQNIVDSTSQTPLSTKVDPDLNQPVLLVGNFGNGRINVFTAAGKFKGQLQASGLAIVIPRVWALSFAPASATSVDPHRLYFTAGPKKETDGIFGYLINQ